MVEDTPGRSEGLSSLVKKQRIKDMGRMEAMVAIARGSPAMMWDTGWDTTPGVHLMDMPARPAMKNVNFHL